MNRTFKEMILAMASLVVAVLIASSLLAAATRLPPLSFRTGELLSNHTGWYGVNSTHPTLSSPARKKTVLTEPDGALGISIELCRNGVRGVAGQGGRMSVSLEHLAFEGRNMTLIVVFVNDGTCDESVSANRAVVDSVGVDVSLSDINLRNDGLVILTGNMTHRTRLSLVRVNAASYTNKVPLINSVVVGADSVARQFWNGDSAEGLASVGLIIGGGGHSKIHGAMNFHECLFEGGRGETWDASASDFIRLAGVVVEAQVLSMMTTFSHQEKFGSGGFAMNRTVIVGGLFCQVDELISFSDGANFGFYKSTFNATEWDAGVAFYLFNATTAVFSNASSLVFEESVFESSGYALRLDMLDTLAFHGHHHHHGLVSSPSSIVHRRCVFTSGGTSILFFKINNMMFADGAMLAHYDSTISGGKGFAFRHVKLFAFVNGSTLGLFNTRITAVSNHGFLMLATDNLTFAGNSKFIQDSCIVSAHSAGGVHSAASSVVMFVDIGGIYFTDGSSFSLLNGTMTDVDYHIVSFQAIETILFTDGSVLSLVDSAMISKISRAVVFDSIDKFRFVNRSVLAVLNCRIQAVFFGGISFGSVRIVEISSNSSFIVDGSNITANPVLTVDRTYDFILSGGSSFTLENSVLTSLKEHVVAWKDIGGGMGVMDGSRVSMYNCSIVAGDPANPDPGDGSGVSALLFSRVQLLILKNGSTVSQHHCNVTATGSLFYLHNSRNISFVERSTLSVFNVGFSGIGHGSSGVQISVVGTVKFIDLSALRIIEFRANMSSNYGVGTSALQFTAIDEALFENQSTFVLKGNSIASSGMKPPCHLHATAFTFRHGSGFAVFETTVTALVSSHALAIGSQHGLTFDNSSTFVVLDSTLSSALRLGQITFNLGTVSFLGRSLLLLRRTTFDCGETCAVAGAGSGAVAVEGLDKFVIDSSSAVHVDNVTAQRKMPILNFDNRGGIVFSQAASSSLPPNGAKVGDARIVISKSYVELVVADGDTAPPTSNATRHPNEVIYSCNRNSAGPVTVVAHASTWAGKARVVPCAAGSGDNDVCNDDVYDSKSVLCFGPNTAAATAPSSSSSSASPASCVCGCAAPAPESTTDSLREVATIGRGSGWGDDEELLNELPLQCGPRIRFLSPKRRAAEHPASATGSLSATQRSPSPSWTEARGTATASASQTVMVSPTLPAPPVQKARKRTVTAFIQFLGGNEEAVQGVETSGAVSAGASGIVAPTTAAYGSRTRSAQVLSQQCLVEGGRDELEPPSAMELPPVVLFATSSEEKVPAGAQHGYVAAMMATLLASVAAISEVLQWRTRATAATRCDSDEEEDGDASRMSKSDGHETPPVQSLTARAAVLVTLLNAVLLQFYSMPVAMSAVTGIVVGGTRASAVGGVVALLLVVANALRIAHVVSAAEEENDSSSTTSETQRADGVVDDDNDRQRDDDGKQEPTIAHSTAVAVYHDATRGFASLRTRLYFVEELAVSLLLGAVAGLVTYDSLFGNSSCVVITWVMAILSAMHVAYIGLIRPYRSRIETAFVSLQAVLQLGQNIVLAGGSTRRSSAEQADKAINASGTFALLANVALVVEAVVLAAWSVRRRIRKKRTAQNGEDVDRSSNSAPLLLISQSDDCNKPLGEDGCDGTPATSRGDKDADRQTFSVVGEGGGEEKRKSRSSRGGGSGSRNHSITRRSPRASSPPAKRSTNPLGAASSKDRHRGASPQRGGHAVERHYDGHGHRRHAHRHDEETV